MRPRPCITAGVLLLATPLLAQQAPPGQVTLRPPAAVEIGENLVPNGGFEETRDGGGVAEWTFSSRNTDATCEVVPLGRMGGQCVRLTNSTPFGPHVYGQLTLDSRISLEPGERYVLSAYVRSDAPGPAWIGGGEGWSIRLSLGPTQGEWKRFSLPFVARGGDAQFALMVNTDGPTGGFLVDDIKLERGDAPTPVATALAPEKTLALEIVGPGSLSVMGEAVELPVSLLAVEQLAGARWSCAIADEDGNTIGTGEGAIGIPAGASASALLWDVSQVGNGPIVIGVDVSADDDTVSATAQALLFTRAGFDRAFAEAEEAREALREALARAQRTSPAAYPRAALAVADRFTGIVEARADAGDLEGATHYAADLVAICEQATREAEAIADGAPDRLVPSYSVDALSLRGREFVADGEPVPLVGPMGFGELEREIETVGDYGFNVIGDDFNSYASLSMVTGPDTFNEEAVPNLLASWERARALNLAIAFNPTLHYFPEWALLAHRDITGGDPVDCLPDWSGLGRHAGKRTKVYGGFFPFAVESESLRALVSRYYATLLPPTKDAPGFQVYWLMNEPTYSSGDDAYLALYADYLRQRYGAISTLNEAWGTEYASFDEAPPARSPDEPGRFDFMSFHNDHVADWFEWLVAEVKRHNPNALVSNKPMAWTLLQPDQGIDFERQALMMDIPGCDASRSPAAHGWAYGWASTTMLLDLWASVAPDRPQADLEYHYVHEPYVSSQYVRATYWQSYLHGMRLSTFWVWSRGQLGAGEAGAGMTHTAWSQPQVGWGTASAALDIRRLAKQIAHFPSPAEVAIYFSKPSLYLGGTAYDASVSSLYTALFFADSPVGFVTDRMIRGGALESYKAVIVPGGDFVEADVLAALRAYGDDGGTLVRVGQCLGRDEYGRAHPNGDAPGRQVPTAPARELRDTLLPILAEAGVNPPVRALLPSGEPAWAVECRSVETPEGVLCSLIHLGEEPVEIALTAPSGPVAACHELITDRPLALDGGRITLQPMDVLLLRM